MNWLKKIPNSIRSASGLEWVLWRKLPLIALMGTLLPLFHWSMVLTAAVGCVIVMGMKGPGYQADSYPLSHSDQPRNDPQSAEEAARYRNTDAPP